MRTGSIAVDLAADLQNGGATADGVALFVPAGSLPADTIPLDAVFTARQTQRPARPLGVLPSTSPTRLAAAASARRRRDLARAGAPDAGGVRSRSHRRGVALAAPQGWAREVQESGTCGAGSQSGFDSVARHGICAPIRGWNRAPIPRLVAARLPGVAQIRNPPPRQA
jgi:hypothetical protein